MSQTVERAHCTMDGARSFVAGTHTDAVNFARHLKECRDGRCRKRLEQAEQELASPVVARLVTAFLRAQERRAYGGGSGCVKIEDILGSPHRVRLHAASCPFCRALLYAYIDAPENESTKQDDGVDEASDIGLPDDDGFVATSGVAVPVGDDDAAGEGVGAQRPSVPLSK